MSDLFTSQELEHLSTRVDEQLRALGAAETTFTRGQKKAQALGEA
jgi:hypothetical protein